MHLLSCEHITMQYDGRNVVNDISFFCGSRGLPLHCRGKWLRQKHSDAGTSGTQTPGWGKRNFRGWTPPARDRLSAPANRCTAGIPHQRGGGGALRIAESVRHAPLLQCSGTKTGGWDHGTPGAYGVAPPQLPCPVRRAAAACAVGKSLCATGKLLLLDEPVSALDPVATADFYALIRKLNREDHIAVIMISHDIQAAVKQANRILHLDSTLRFFGTTAEYLQSDVGHAFCEA